VGGVVLGLCISAALLAVVTAHWDLSLEQLSGQLQQANTGWVLAALASSVLLWLTIYVHKTYLVLQAHGVPLTFRETLRLMLSIGPLQLVLPLKGGEVVAILFTWRRLHVPLGRATGAFLFNRITNLTAWGFLLLGGMAFGWREAPVRLGVSVASLCAILLVLLYLTPLHELVVAAARLVHVRVAEQARKLFDAWRAIPVGKSLLLQAYGMAAVGRLVLVCQLLFRAFGVRVAVSRVLVYTAVSVFAGHLPGPFMGIGAREGAMVSVAGNHEGGEAAAMGVGLFFSLSIYLVPMLMGLPWVPGLLRELMRRDQELPDAGEDG